MRAAACDFALALQKFRLVVVRNRRELLVRTCTYVEVSRKSGLWASKIRTDPASSFRPPTSKANVLTMDFSDLLRCPVCFDDFDYDPSLFTTDEEKRSSRLPTLSAKCSHKICASCLNDWWVVAISDKSAKAKKNEPKWFKCHTCKEKTAFNAVEVKFDTGKCSDIAAIRSLMSSGSIASEAQPIVALKNHEPECDEDTDEEGGKYASVERILEAGAARRRMPQYHCSSEWRFGSDDNIQRLTMTPSIASRVDRKRKFLETALEEGKSMEELKDLIDREEEMQSVEKFLGNSAPRRMADLHQDFHGRQRQKEQKESKEFFEATKKDMPGPTFRAKKLRRSDPGDYEFAVISGAGLAATNGLYERTKEICDGLPVYQMQGAWGGRPCDYCLFRCKLSNGERKWFISYVPRGVKPGTTRDVNFYSADPVGLSDFPPEHGWVRSTVGIDPAPSVRRHGRDMADKELPDDDINEIDLDSLERFSVFDLATKWRGQEYRLEIYGKEDGSVLLYYPDCKDDETGLECFEGAEDGERFTLNMDDPCDNRLFDGTNGVLLDAWQRPVQCFRRRKPKPSSPSVTPSRARYLLSR